MYAIVRGRGFFQIPFIEEWYLRLDMGSYRSTSMDLFQILFIERWYLILDMRLDVDMDPIW